MGPTEATGQATPAPLAERTYQMLRTAILKGEFAAGERLAGDALASRLGVSRTPVRHALTRLQAEGLVETADGRSAWVRPLTASDVEQAYDIAEGLEGVLVARLAARATEEQLSAISEAVARMEQTVGGDRHAWVQADSDFHARLAEFGDNPLMASMLARVDTVIHRIRFLSLALHPNGAGESAHDHRAVTDALEERDGVRARELHQQHWSRVRETNVALLRETFAPLGSIANISQGSSAGR